MRGSRSPTALGGDDSARRRLSRLLLFAGALIVVLLTASCGSDEPSRGEAQALAEVQELVIGAPENTTEIKPPPEANVALGYGDANAPVFETLVRMPPDFSIEPLLATEWEFEAPSTWRFKLREGVTFHNGDPFNAEAVAYTVNKLWAKQDANILGVDSDSAKVVDEHTVEVTTKEPNLRLVEQLVHPSNAIQAPDTYAGEGTEPKSTPTGTGPFQFVSYDKPTEMVVKRFENYWGPTPTLQKITFRFIPDDNSRVLALRAGEVDAIYDVPREQANQLEQAEGVHIARSKVGAYDALLVNSHGERPYDILGDPQVRKALTHAIDKQTVVDNVWKGNAEVMNTVIPAPVLGQYADLVRGYPYDPNRAGQLLDEAGWTMGSDGIRTKDDRSLKLTLVVVDAELQRPMPELVKSQLKKVGIDLQIDVPGDANVYYDRIESGKGDLFAEVGNQNDANPIFLGAIFTGVQPGGFSSYGEAFGPHGRYDEIFKKAFTTPDTEEVRRMAAEAMHVAVDQYVAGIPIAGIYRIWGLSDRVQGFQPHPSAVNQYWSMVRMGQQAER